MKTSIVNPKSDFPTLLFIKKNLKQVRGQTTLKNSLEKVSQDNI